MTDALAAASLIVMRDADDGPPALLIVERGRALAFAGGALAFPGGRVDAADRALAAAAAGEGRGGDDAGDAAARIAALRELREETGLDAADVAGADVAGAGALVPFARWCPRDNGQPRRFDTRFYLARARPTARPAPDGGEIVRAFWCGARAAIGHADAGRARMLFPTRCLLERLARYDSFAAARADAEARPPRLIRPEVVADAGGTRWLTIPGDLGYPYTRQPLDTVDRG